MRPQGRKLALILEWQPRRSDLGADYNPEWYSGTSVGTPDPRNRNYNNRMEAQWIVAPVGWRVDTHQRRLPTALVASIQEQDRRRVRYLRQIEGHRFRVTITAGREVIVSLRHNHAEERRGCEDA
ncbi:uncharacterized protein [Drosophila suzukii]|uniref:Uncharacterized protein n=1 Tax=Drosophila suzukii TaxID=28584 RepID=A0ABM4TYD4_DROSZ